MFNFGEYLASIMMAPVLCGPRTYDARPLNGSTENSLEKSTRGGKLSITKAPPRKVPYNPKTVSRTCGKTGRKE